MKNHQAASIANAETQELWALDQRHFLHPMSVWPVFKKQGSTIMTRGEGVYVYDSDGNRYIDTNGGLWSVNIGHGRKEMAEAIAEQAMTLAQINHYSDLSSSPGIRLAAKLAELAPGDLNHVFFSNGGSLANDSAVRIAHHYFIQSGKPEKKHIIARIDSYHGSTYLTASMSGRAAFRKARFHYEDDLIHFVSSPSAYRAPAGLSGYAYCDHLVQELEDKILEIGPDKVACFFAEPVVGLGGVLTLPEGYHARTLDVCRKYDVLYVHDEVITGFGRLGHMFTSQDLFGMVPDIITCAKGLTSGYQPLAATIISDKLFDTISASGYDAPFATGFTYTGHPVCCAAGLKNIEIIEREKICEHVRELGRYFKARFAELGELPLVGDARGIATIFCLEHVRDKNSKELFRPDVAIGQRIANEALKHGLYVRGVGETVLISPPLILTREHVDKIVDGLRESELVVEKQLRAEGVWQ